MKPFVHHVMAGSALLLLGACTTYKPLDGGSTVPWASSAPTVLAVAPAAGPVETNGDRSRLGIQPVTVSEVPAADLTGQVHRIERGESLAMIARRYRISVTELAAENRLQAPYRIYAGEILRIPGGAEIRPAAARAEQHVVRRGDNLSAIAERYGVSVTALARANELRSANAIYVGQSLTLPAGAAPVAAAAVVEGEAEDGYLWPVQGKVVTRFGRMNDGEISHGITIAARKGAPVRAAGDGEVIYAGDAIRGYGRMILVRHDDDFVTTYAHNQALLVGVGDSVERGQVIARVGDTGGVGQPQLHFELRKGRKPLDPEDYLVEPATAVASTR